MSNHADIVDDPAPSEPDGRARAFAVRLALVCTVLIFVTCASWTAYRGWTIEVPDSMLVVRGTSAWEGLQASVDHVTFHTPLEATFDSRSRNTISFHLSPGKYTLTIRRGSAVLFTYDFELTRRSHIGVLHLPPSLEGLTPATQPDQPRPEFEPRWPRFIEVERM
jgi:hypothetical protein